MYFKDDCHKGAPQTWLEWVNYADGETESEEMWSSISTQEQRMAMLSFISLPVLLTHHPNAQELPSYLLLTNPGQFLFHSSLGIHLQSMSVLCSSQYIKTRAQLPHTTFSREERLLPYHGACKASKLHRTPPDCS